MPEPANTSTFLRFLREAMTDIGAQSGRGLRRGAEGIEDFVTPGRSMAAGAYGAGAGAGLAGMYAGANGNYQDDDLGEAGAGALAGGVGGGLAGLAGMRGARGSARMLRAALERVLREDAAPPASAEMGQMELMQRLEQFIAARRTLDDEDPRAQQLDMIIQTLQQQLMQIGG